MSLSSAKRLVVETWTWWSVGMILLTGRITSRSLQRGFRHLQIDDAIIVVVMVAFTGLVVTYNLLSDYSTNLFYPGQSIDDLTSQDLSNIIYGSKIAFASEQCNLATTWGSKACILILYHRLTVADSASHLIVNTLGAFSIFFYAAIQICLFAVWCRPISQYWAVYVRNEQCATYENHLILSTSLNITSDLVMLAVGLSLILRLHLPLRRRWILFGIFSLGIFAIAGAAISLSFFIKNPYSADWPFWTIRACGASFYVTNLPYWWTLLRRMFNLHSFDANADTNYWRSANSPDCTNIGNDMSRK